MNTYGYVRVSSIDQNEDRQILAMRERIPKEKNIYMGIGFSQPTTRNSIVS